MTLAYAMLLDGGFLRYKLSKRQAPVDAAGISAFTARVSALPCLQGMRLHRIYFYDSKPLETSENKPLGGGQIDFGVTAAAARNKSLQSSLMREPFFALRFGDIASLTLKRHAQVIVLVTADSDFVPAMKFARREGAQLVLVTAPPLRLNRCESVQRSTAPQPGQQVPLRPT